MADVGGEVDADAVVADRREVLGEAGEVPRDAGRERGDVHVLDVLERAGDEVVVLDARRRDREAAVAGDDGGDAVEARRRERGIPEHLRVVVRVDVDEPGRDDAVAGVEHTVAVEVRTDLGDATAGDADVGAHARCAGAVVDGPALDHGLVRHVVPPGSVSGQRRSGLGGGTCHRGRSPPIGASG